MVAFIVLFLPAVLSVWLWEVFSKTQLNKKKWFYLLSLNIMLVNIFCFAVKKWVLLTAGNSLSGLAADMTPAAAFNYLVMAIPAAVALALVENFVFRKVRLQVEDKQEDEDTDETT